MFGRSKIWQLQPEPMLPLAEPPRQQRTVLRSPSRSRQRVRRKPHPKQAVCSPSMVNQPAMHGWKAAALGRLRSQVQAGQNPSMEQGTLFHFPLHFPFSLNATAGSTGYVLVWQDACVSTAPGL